jgi:hypothetical protein
MPEVLPGLWQFEAPHPEWTEEEGGEDGWEQVVAWWALRTRGGLVLIDPLVEDWDELDRLVGEHGGCAGIVRTIHFHQRSIAEAATRYGAEVSAGIAPDRVRLQPSDRVFGETEHTWPELEAFGMERFDEIALWLPEQSALLFGDAMLRREDGMLRVCPESWTQPPGGHERLRELLRGLTRLPVEHVLVSHGPLVLGDGNASLSAALG